MKKPIWICSLLFCLAFWASVVALSFGLLPSCAKIGDAGIYVVQANDLADEAVTLERIVLLADVPVEQKPALIAAVNDLKLIANEYRRFDGATDLTRLDLSRMHRAYLRVKADVIDIREMIYDWPELATWESIPERDRYRLTLFWHDASDLARDIDSFIADPDTNQYLQIAARITAYGTLAARIMLAVTPQLEGL